MTYMLRRGAALAVCVLMSGWLAPLANGAGTGVPAPPPPAGHTPKNSTSYSQVPSPFSLTISPTRLVLGPADAGKVSKILVVNRGQAPLPIIVEKRNFTGTPSGALDFQATAPYSASSWLTVTPTSFVVPPGGVQTVTAAFTVPAAPEPGDHQVAVVFLVPAAPSKSNIKINRGVGAPVYITVAGPTDNTAVPSDLSAPGFVMGGPVTVSAKVEDTGTIHRDFRGTTPLAISAAGSAATFPDFTVMRGSTRDISTTWDPPLICACHLSVSIVNANGEIRTTTVRVIVFPLWQLGVLIVAALLITLAVIWRRRRYRAHVAAAATRSRHAAGGQHA